MKANKSVFVAMMMVLAAVAMMGCQPVVGPGPDPIPDPVKVYLTDNGESFTRVDEAGTLDYADIYQWDGEGTMYTGDDVVIEFDDTYGTEWTITVGGNVYLNNANIGVVFDSDNEVTIGDGTFSVVSDEVVATFVGDGTEYGFNMVTYIGSHQFTAGGVTFTRR